MAQATVNAPGGLSKAIAEAEKARVAAEEARKSTFAEWQEQVESGAWKGEKGDAGAIKIIPVHELPTEDIAEDAIYLIPRDSSEEENVFDEYIYVDGAWERLFGAGVAVNLDDYVKKMASPEAGANALYGIDATGAPKMFVVRVGQAANAIQISDGFGCLSAATPRYDNHAANKGYVDGGFIPRINFTGSSGYKMYVNDQNNQLKEMVIAFSNTVPTGYRIPVANGSGCLAVANPTEDKHAANKKYVDNLFKLSRGIRGADEVFEDKCAGYSATVGMALNDWLYDYSYGGRGIYSVYKYNVQGLSRVTFLGYLYGTLDNSESKRNIFMAYHDNGSCVQATDNIAVTPATSGDGPFTVDIPQGVNYIYFSTTYGTDPVIWGS